MKAVVTDAIALRSLLPYELASYLRSNGWKQVQRMGEKATIWSQPAADSGEFEVLLPMRRDLADFALRMADVLQILETVEQRSQLEILNDLSVTSADVIRIRAQQPDSQNGTISLDDGVELVEAAREILLAAACATVESRPHFATRKPSLATRYLESVRLGQTERGSYVVTLLSPVPPEIMPTRDGQGTPDVEDPFERRVTLTLASALSAVREAAQDVVTAGSFETFQAAVSKGVNANLCEAIAAMAGGGSRTRDVEFNLTWSRVRPVETPLVQNITISADAVPFIKEAGRIFRQTSPRDDFELVGMVTGLQSQDPEAAGKVTVTALVDEAARKVNLTLEGLAYQLAIQAHGQVRFVRCLGRLVKRAHLLELEEPHQFEILPEEGP